MSWNYGFRPYVPVAQRRARAARELTKLSKKSGHGASPVQLSGRKIASTFWGKAWCDNLERYSDYANRLPRGRTYIRNGSVVDLQISRGVVCARVSGSSLYKIEIQIKPLAAGLWESIQAECAGKIDSLIELLQGKLSAAVMQIVTRPERGLFPSPKEIKMECSCPDWADLCKHLAATLYGVGARLDHNPELLFLLRGVDPSNLISRASAAEAVRQTTQAGNAPAMSDTEMADVFGIELASGVSETATPSIPDGNAAVVSKPDGLQPPPAQTTTKGKTLRRKRANAGTKTNSPKPAARKMSAAARARIAAAQKARLAAARKRA